MSATSWAPNLPVQTIFQAPTLAGFAAATTTTSRGRDGCLRLAGTAGASTTLLWPGLGGYPMSLRTLAGELAQHDHSV